MRAWAIGGVASLLAFGAGLLGAMGQSTAPGSAVPFERVERPEPTVELWVGALCKGGGMVVASSQAPLQAADCRDQWRQVLTEAQVRALSR